MSAIVLHIECVVVTAHQRSDVVKATAEVLYQKMHTNRWLYQAIENWRPVRNRVMHEYNGYRQYVCELDRLQRTWSIILENVKAAREAMRFDFVKQVLYFYRVMNK